LGTDIYIYIYFSLRWEKISYASGIWHSLSHKHVGFTLYETTCCKKDDAYTR
jgi:hypothetical protein